MTELLIIAIAGVGMWMMRASFITFGARRTLPAQVDRALGQARFAALAALAALALMPYLQSASASGSGPALAGSFAAVLVAHRWHSLPRTLVAGLAVFWAASQAF